MTLSIDHLSPYGLLYFPFSTVADRQFPPPTDFMVGEDNTKRQTAKNKFIDDTLASISTEYWPQWQNGKWTGASHTNAVALMQDDFMLLTDLRKKISGNIFIANTSPHILRTHEDAFKTEDRDGHDPFEDNDPYLNFQQFRYYATSLTLSWHDAFPKLFLDSIVNKVGNMTMELKWRLQRPRPYQTALQLGIKDFSYLHAKTGLHPSLVAGHCMQGLFGGMGVNAAWAGHAEYTPQVQAALQQYSTDFGDRRVLAGVHYPSDSLISWLVCFDLLPFVFTANAQAEAKKFLQSCIQRSIVWDHVISNQASLYQVYKTLIKHLSEKL